MKTRLLCIIAVLILAGCTMKTATYNFNQGIPAPTPQQVALGVAPGNQGGTGERATNSGGAGNTIIIIEETKQDSQSTLDPGSLTDTLAGKIKLPSLPSVIPSTPPAADEEIAEPEALEDNFPKVEEVD